MAHLCLSVSLCFKMSWFKRDNRDYVHDSKPNTIWYVILFLCFYISLIDLGFTCNVCFVIFLTICELYKVVHVEKLILYAIKLHV